MVIGNHCRNFQISILAEYPLGAYGGDLPGTDGTMRLDDIAYEQATAAKSFFAVPRLMKKSSTYALLADSMYTLEDNKRLNQSLFFGMLRAQNINAGIALRHNNAGNILFADGHVGNTRSDMRTLSDPKSENIEYFVTADGIMEAVR